MVLFEDFGRMIDVYMCRYTVATTTIWSGLSYVFSKDAVKILKYPTVPAEQEKEETKMKQ
jgi:cardiolipin synthase